MHILKKSGSYTLRPDLLYAEKYRLLQIDTYLAYIEDQMGNDYHAPETKIINTNQRGKSADITFTMLDTKYAIERYNIYINGVPIFPGYGKLLDTSSAAADQEITLTETVELSAGENRIEVVCMNEKYAQSYRSPITFTYDEAVKPDLYFCGFGGVQLRRFQH